MTEVSELLPVTDGATRRSMFAGLVSLAAHGGVVLLIVAIARGHVAVESSAVEFVPIEFVNAPPPAPPPPPPGSGGQQRSTTSTSLGTLGRHGHDAPRSQSHAQVTADPHADLVMSYEALTSPEPGNEAGNEAGTTGRGFGWGLTGAGTGGGDGFGQFGLGNVPPPPPPPPPPPLTPSLARPPVPKASYHSWDFQAQGRFLGGAVLVELNIDPAGSVRQVRILRGVNEDIDQRAIDVARRFAFYPALDAAGHPTWGLHRWEFVIGSAGNPGFHFH